MKHIIITALSKKDNKSGLIPIIIYFSFLFILYNFFNFLSRKGKDKTVKIKNNKGNNMKKIRFGSFKTAYKDVPKEFILAKEIQDRFLQVDGEEFFVKDEKKITAQDTGNLWAAWRWKYFDLLKKIKAGEKVVDNTKALKSHIRSMKKLAKPLSKPSKAKSAKKLTLKQKNDAIKKYILKGLDTPTTEPKKYSKTKKEDKQGTWKWENGKLVPTTESRKEHFRNLIKSYLY